MFYDTGLNLLPCNKSLHNDIAFGLNNEPIVIDRLTKYFGEEIEKTKSKYCYYDAFSSNTKYEIKSRRCRYDTYSTTIIPIHKRKENENSRLVFVFHFLDGLYYIVFNKDLFETFEIKEFIYYRQGCANLPVKHFLIPIECLLKIDL